MAGARHTPGQAGRLAPLRSAVTGARRRLRQASAAGSRAVARPPAASTWRPDLGGDPDAAHADGVERLLTSYRRIPEASTVRLAKTTSNLFRPRTPAAPGQGVPGLDVSGLGGVISVDPRAATAQVQGMCTYERLVAATLPHGLMPLVVPQLRTITLGGAVTGLGIESTSFRHGLPHESVRELDILTADGQIVTARPTGEHAELFAAFPNSYGSLGYATRLEIELTAIGPFVGTRIIPFGDLDALTETISQIMDTGQFDGLPVHGLDGVVFDATEAYLVLAHFDAPAGSVSDYTGSKIYYRSLRERRTDCLSDAGYLWRWDTDWFWCSQAFGAQHPVIRRLWPARYRRSDVYHRIVGWEQRRGVAARIDRWRGEPPRERVVQDVEIPLAQTAAFLRWFLPTVGMNPVWLCPLRLREPNGPGSARSWPLYPLTPGIAYVNLGFWGTVPIRPGQRDGDVNRLIERAVIEADGHKSLYSDAYYDRSTFDARYGGAAYRHAKNRYDPQGRFADLYQKVVKP